MEVNREAILDRTHYGLNIYSHVLRKYYPGETVLSLAGRGCDPAKNPFNDSKTTLWIRIIDGCACHIDTERAIENGDAFDFAALHFKVKGQELYEILNKELHLRIGEHHPFYDYNKGEAQSRAETRTTQAANSCFQLLQKAHYQYQTNRL